MQYRIDADAHAALPEALQAEYAKSDDGSYRLKVEGEGNPADRLTEFRESAKKLDARLKAFGDLTPEQVAELRAERDALKSKAEEAAQAAAGKEQTVAQQLAEMRSEFAAQLKERDAALEAERRQARFRDLAGGAGVKPQAMRYVVADLEAAGFRGDEMLTEDGRSPADVLAGMRKEQAFLFEENRGAGAKPGAPTSAEERTRRYEAMTPAELGGQLLKDVPE